MKNDWIKPDYNPKTKEHFLMFGDHLVGQSIGSTRGIVHESGVLKLNDAYNAIKLTNQDELLASGEIAADDVIIEMRINAVWIDDPDWPKKLDEWEFPQMQNCAKFDDKIEQRAIVQGFGDVVVVLNRKTNAVTANLEQNSRPNTIHGYNISFRRVSAKEAARLEAIAMS